MIRYPERFLELPEKDKFQRIYAFDMILRHLHKNKNDPRKRERERTKVALKRINKWIALARKEYAKLSEEGFTEGN